jgi:ABC-type branched-subunit amino acid transport system substrate-binding protein
MRRLPAASCALALTLALAACGSSSGGSGGTSSAAGASGSGGGGTSAGGALNIGVIYPFTGANADQGAVGMAGCLAGISEVNAAGGALGHKFACKPFDTKGDPADAVPAANQMMASASPVMVIGASDDAVATAPIVTGQHVPNFATIGDPHFDTQTNPYFYRLTPSDALQGVALGYWAAKHGQTHAAAAFTSDLGAQTSVPPLRTEYAKLGGKFAADVKLAPGQSSYRTEISSIIAAHPDSLISEMDPQSSTTFLSEYKQLNGTLPQVLGTERTSNSDWIQAVLGGIGQSTFVKSIRSITPYVQLSGPGYDAYKTELLKLGSQVKNPAQYVGQPYAISDFDAVNITALAMTMAKSTTPSVYNADIPKVTQPGGTVVHTFATALAALKTGKTIQYVGASGPLVFNKYHSAGRAFSYDVYDPKAKAMKPTTVIPGTALNGG